RIGTPWSGLGVATGRWDAADVVVLTALVGLLVVACVRGLPLTWSVVLGLSVCGSLFLGWNVWERWEDVTRVLLPACAVALVARLPAAADAATRRPAVPGAQN